MITAKGNYGVNGVLTGLPGSVRTPRILSASILGTGGTFTSLPPNRYINDQPLPLFIEQITIMLPTAVGVLDVVLEMKAAGYNVTLTPGKVLGMTEFISATPAILTWKLDRPLILFQNEGLIFTTDAPPNTIVAALGYYESKPAPQQFRYVPVVLTDAIRVTNGSRGDFREEALRNDGKLPIYLTQFGISSVNATGDTQWRIRGTEYDWMSERLSGNILSMQTIQTKLYESLLLPSETLSVQVENNTGSDGDFYVGFVGFRAIPLKEEKSHECPVPGQGRSNPEALFNWQL